MVHVPWPWVRCAWNGSSCRAGTYKQVRLSGQIYARSFKSGTCHINCVGRACNSSVRTRMYNMISSSSCIRSTYIHLLPLRFRPIPYPPTSSRPGLPRAAANAPSQFFSDNCFPSTSGKGINIIRVHIIFIRTANSNWSKNQC